MCHSYTSAFIDIYLGEWRPSGKGIPKARTPNRMTLEYALILIFIVMGVAVLPLKFGLWRYLTKRRPKGDDPE